MVESLPHPARSFVLSYTSVRRAIGVIGLLLPVALAVGGWLAGVEIQDNMSLYYHTPMRDLLVGMLCTLGVFLFCYRGHDRVENWTANLACVFALGLAFLPTDAGSDPLRQGTVVGLLHTVCGGGFFLTLAYYALFHFPSTKPTYQEGEPHPAQRNLLYRLSGLLILLCMIVMGAYLLVLPEPWTAYADRYHALFWLEWIAVWSFASAWLIKGRIIIAELAVALLAVTQEKLMIPHWPGTRHDRGEEDRG